MSTTVALAQSTDATTQAEEKPSEESVRNLLEVMQAKQTLQVVLHQMSTMFDSTVSRELDGQSLTPEQLSAIEERRKAAADMINKLMDWDSMERLYLKVYTETFTQSEIDGMTAFYASPAGHAVIVKMPLAVKNTMSEMQQRMQQLVPKLQQMAKEAAEQAKSQRPAKKVG